MRPEGSFSTSIFSPGRTPKCSSTSLRSVTCPFAVTVSVCHGLQPDHVAIRKKRSAQRPRGTRSGRRGNEGRLRGV
jgi:hypothetical protein